MIYPPKRSNDGALSGIRTLDLLIKSQLLLPAELRAHMTGYYGRSRRVERLDFHYWSWRQESNLQPAAYKAAALPLSHASIYRIHYFLNDESKR